MREFSFIILLLAAVVFLIEAKAADKRTKGGFFRYFS